MNKSPNNFNYTYGPFIAMVIMLILAFVGFFAAWLEFYSLATFCGVAIYFIMYSNYLGTIRE